MNLSRTLITCFVFGQCMIPAHAQFQVVHNAPNTTSDPQITALILNDGSTVTHHWDGQHVFRKYDVGGGLVWSKGMEGGGLDQMNWGPYFVMFKNGMDGFRFVRFIDEPHTPSVDPNWDHVEMIHFQIINVNGLGEPTSGHALKKTYGINGGILAFPSAIDGTSLPNGDLVLAMTLDLNARSVELVRMNVDGGLEWCRSVGQQYGISQTPTATFDPHPSARVAASPSGRIYVTEGSRNVFSNLRLAELSSAGELLWMKRYVYANISPSAQFHDIAVDLLGNVHAGGALNTSVGHFHYFLRTQPDGILGRGDLYRTAQGLYSGSFELDAQGRRYHFVNTWAPPQGILVADTLGNPAQYLRRADQVSLPNNVFFKPYAMALSGDRVALSGQLHHEHVDLAFTTRYESLASMETGALSACLMSDTTLAHIEIPLSIMTTEDVPNAVSIDVSEYYTSEPISLSFTSLDPEPLEGLCAFASEILGVSVGMEEANSTEQPPLVLNSLVAQGTPVLLNHPRANTVAVYDVHGGLVQRTSLSASRAVATTGWSTGVYILHTMDAHGAPLRVGRVVVE